MMEVNIDTLEQFPEKEVHLITGESNGTAYWRYIRVSQLKQPLFEAALASGNITPNDFGEVLYAGEGEEPPKNIQNLIKLKTKQTAETIFNCQNH